ncbi:acyltransferase [Paenibacillus sp. Y412MC10]|uniref:acyltransferase family protein n=1 Tax=Geobacillus sp. (strain Y412MC10) TaxID=481743 RepID=UPI0011A01A4D|nr:acyltransferase [Paenibacillus sp. Y412MC10]
MSNPRQAHYIPGLDGIRALAVCAVIAYHLNLGWFPGGFLGVGIFFVLSGYLITDLLIRQWEGTGRIDLRDFWVRRARRLLPAMCSVLLVVIVWLALFQTARLAEIWGDIAASLLYVTNWWFIVNDTAYFSRFSTASPLMHFWSLAVEEQFYLVWPVIHMLGLRFVTNRKLLFAIILIGALASASAMYFLYVPGLLDTSRVYYGTDTRAFSLLMGAGLALCRPAGNWGKEGKGRTGLSAIAMDFTGFVGFAVLIWMICGTSQYEPFLYQGGMVLQSTATAAVIAAAVQPSTWIGHCLSWKPLRWLGIRSYGIYLWHYPILLLTFTGEERSFLHTAVQMTAVLVIAAISWTYLEKPIRYGYSIWSRQRGNIDKRSSMES